MNKFIEYIGIEKLPMYKVKSNYINYDFETTLEFEEDFKNAEITKIYLNLTTEAIKNIEVKNISFCTVKIDISLEYLDENKFNTMLLKKLTFYKSFFIKNSVGYLLKLHNIITDARLFEISKIRYYIYLNIYSIEKQ